MKYIFSEYLKYRTEARGYDLGKIEDILKFSTEKYLDTITNRMIVIGKHDKRLVMIPYEISKNSLKPVTIHATSRQQINFRLKTGRLKMNKTKMKYFKDDDIIHINISDGMETNSVELSPNITAEIDENGELIGIEILNASTFVQRFNT